ncbi:hypothetical protein XA68_12912 [Ophiocordyceps unilateralis]|uniref:Uncharacterized protein n=1 Tax=Ophiocordyceps unilateralis TaxID=268505 RepID=A0A2A9PDN6_OPHUN|nr:hypothetical protein XA68_12912 [Ophiocordyceps unilateralis]
MPYFLSPSVSVPLPPTGGRWSRAQTQQGPKGPSSRRAASWSGWEAKQPDSRKIRRHITSSCRQSSEAHGPDRILRWNMARDLPERRHETDPAVGPSLRHGAIPDLDREGSRASTKEVEPLRRDGEKHAADKADESEPPSTTTDVQRHLAQTRLMVEQKREARRQRRSLKESGDYLGVQGINPATGQLDIITPTDSDRSSASLEKEQKLGVLKAALRDARQSYRNVKVQSEREARRMLDKEAQKLRRLEKEKLKLQNLGQRVRWQKQTKQWSSAQEPELSPIVGSRRGSSMAAGRLSKHHNAMEHTMELASESSLAGMTSHGQQPENGQPRQTAADTADSANTVIRTPHTQQSLATPSAWELFAHGITFDSLEPTVPAAESFLGHGAGLRPDPGGVGTGKIFSARHDLGLVQQDDGPEARRQHTGPKPDHDRPVHGLEIHGASTDSQMSRSAGRSVLRRLMTPFGNLLAKRTDGSRSPTRGEGEAARKLSADFVQHRSRDSQQGPTAEAEAAPSIMAAQPVGQTTTWQQNPTDGPPPAQLRSQEIIDDGWVKRALRDLEDTGDRSTGELAFTPITTTTGFDHPSNQIVGGEEIHQQTTGRRQLSRVIHNLPYADENDMVTTEKAMQNALPSLTQAPPGGATDTTSAVTEEQTGGCYAKPLPAAATVDLPCSTSLKSTFSRQMMDCSGGREEERQEVDQKTTLLAELNEATMLSKVKTQVTEPSEVTVEAHAQPVDNGKSTMDKVDERLIPQVPGAFPVETDNGRGSDDGKTRAGVALLDDDYARARPAIRLLGAVGAQRDDGHGRARAGAGDARGPGSDGRARVGHVACGGRVGARGRGAQLL